MMKFLAFLAMLSGALLAILSLRVWRAKWDEFWTILGFTLLPNALTALFAYAVFRRDTTGAWTYKGLLLGGYLVGIVGGTYLYYT